MLEAKDLWKWKCSKTFFLNRGYTKYMKYMQQKTERPFFIIHLSSLLIFPWAFEEEGGGGVVYLGILNSPILG